MEKGSAGWRERLGRLVRSEFFPFLVFGAFMLAVHLTFNTMLGDDDYHFSILMGEGSLFSQWWGFLVRRYFNASARQLIDALLLLIVHAPLLWKVLDTLVLVLVGVLLSRFFNDERSAALNWFIVYALFTFPLRLMRTAGWVSTTLNYLWPMAMGMYALQPIVNAVKGRPTKRHVYVLSLIVLPYAVNHEQMCCAFLALCGFFAVWLWIRDRKLSKFALCQLLIGLAMLVYILTCPGTAVRSASETEKWFPEFANLSFLNKVELGYSSTLFQCIMEPNLVFSLLTMVLALTAFLYDKRPWVRLIAAVPFASTLIFGTFGELAEQVIPYLADMRNQLGDTGTGFRLFKFHTWPPDLFVGFVVLCLIAALWLVFRDRGRELFPIYLLLVGLASRMMMGFSPTVWASRERTFTIAYFAMLAIAVMLVRKLLLHPENGLYRKFLHAGIALHFIFIAEEYMYYLTKI